MTYLNWIIEAIKWKILVNKFEPIKLSESLKSVFVGLVFGMITPNRIGEIAGRSVYLQKKNYQKGVLSTSIGSISQLLVTLLAGFVAIIYYYYYYSQRSLFLSLIVVLLIGLFALVSAIFLFDINKKFARLFFRFIQYISLKISFEFVHLVSKKDFVNLFFLSSIRYIIFSTQFLLFLYLYHVSITVIQASLSVALTYFIICIIPGFALAELGIRGSVSLFCFSLFTNNTGGVLAASVSIYILNILLPAFIGTCILLKTKFRTHENLLS
jgi:uncharacterized membrane protein YbhN (UPF0104 family)